MEFTLTSEHIEQLKKLRKNKVDILFRSVPVIALMTLFVFILPYFLIASFFHVDISSFEYIAVQLLILILFVGAYIIVLNYFFIGIVLKLKKDIKKRAGIIERHEIMRKQYFPLTKEMFFFFQDSSMPNIEIDLDTFNKFKEGDLYTVLKGKNSKIVLQDIHRREININAEFDELGQYSSTDFF